MDEDWRPVPGYESSYLVSDLGRVHSLDRRILRIDGKVKVVVGRIMRQTPNYNGHLRVQLYSNRKGVPFFVHTLVMAAFVGPRYEGMEVRHLNGDPADNRLSNLAYGTRSDNMVDSIRHGTHWPTNKTHCPHGHPYDQANTLVHQGRRFCLTCKRKKGPENAALTRRRIAAGELR